VSAILRLSFNMYKAENMNGIITSLQPDCSTLVNTIRTNSRHDQFLAGVEQRPDRTFVSYAAAVGEMNECSGGECVMALVSDHSTTRPAPTIGVNCDTYRAYVLRTDHQHSCVIRTTLVAAAGNSASLVVLCYSPIMSRLLCQLIG